MHRAYIRLHGTPVGSHREASARRAHDIEQEKSMKSLKSILVLLVIAGLSLTVQGALYEAKAVTCTITQLSVYYYPDGTSSTFMIRECGDTSYATQTFFDRDGRPVMVNPYSYNNKL
jgi:hypothetical protein